MGELVRSTTERPPRDPLVAVDTENDDVALTRCVHDGVFHGALGNADGVRGDVLGVQPCRHLIGGGVLEAQLVDEIVLGRRVRLRRDEREPGAEIGGQRSCPDHGAPTMIVLLECCEHSCDSSAVIGGRRGRVMVEIGGHAFMVRVVGARDQTSVVRRDDTKTPVARQPMRQGQASGRRTTTTVPSPGVLSIS